MVMGPNPWVTLVGTAPDMLNAKFGKIRVTRPMLTCPGLIFICHGTFFWFSLVLHGLFTQNQYLGFKTFII